MPTTAQAQPAAPVQHISAQEPLTVTNIIIDKTEKNAVTAREQAIVEAQRMAFQKLAENAMSLENFQSLSLPDDKMIAAFVQDFEIKNEQISPNRYIANFTVRFGQEAADYIQQAGGTISTQPLQNTAPLPAPVIASGAAAALPPVSILVLPYFKDISGKSVLWEDPNPWREVWQKLGNSTPAPGVTVMVPLGDIADISFGNAATVWTGDYSTVEKLRDNYKADEVLLAVANKSDTSIQVDIYTYKNGKIINKKSLPPGLAGQDYKAAFQSTLDQIVSDARPLKPGITLSEQSGETPPLTDLAGGQKNTASVSQPVEKISLKATMIFDSFSQWAEAQKRLSSISPTLVLDISSLSKNAASFTITVDSIGGMDGLKTSLAGKGLVLNAAADEQILSGQPLYTLQLN